MAKKVAQFGGQKGHGRQRGFVAMCENGWRKDTRT